jgi:uncharacterized membrane protein SirB2
MPDSFSIIKALHLTCAVLSIGGFVLRGVWMLRGSTLLQARLTRILPHVNDTLLFGAGLWLMVTTRQYPDQHPWLTAKLIAIVAYILLGMVALKRGRTPLMRAAAFCGALSIFGYIVLVALTRSPWPF